MRNLFDSFIEMLSSLAEMFRILLIEPLGYPPVGTAIGIIMWLLVLTIAGVIIVGIFSSLNIVRTKLCEWDCTVIKKTIVLAYTTTDLVPGYGMSFQASPVVTFTPVSRTVPDRHCLYLDMAGHRGWLTVDAGTFARVDAGDTLTLTYRVGRLNGKIYMLSVR